MLVRKHLEAIKPDVEAGKVVFGGATLDEPVKEGQSPKLNGSAMLLCADTEEAARRWVENDIYYKNKVWDASKVRGQFRQSQEDTIRPSLYEVLSQDAVVESVDCVHFGSRSCRKATLSPSYVIICKLSMIVNNH